jgi:ADP-ribosylglycohydrolase
MTKTPMDRMLGVTYGLAYGDALGRPTEFVDSKTLARFGSPFRDMVGLNSVHSGIVTDDTQMSLAVAKAALITDSDPDPQTMADQFVKEFIGWYKDPKSRDGKRASGGTCLGAVGALIYNPRQWLLATRPDSKGNGANMRVAPLALRTDWSWDTLAKASQLQAAITHGHPTALAAANLTAVAVRMLLEGIAKPNETLLDHLLAYAVDNREVYHGDWLGHLWEQTPKPLPQAGLWEHDVWAGIETIPGVRIKLPPAPKPIVHPRRAAPKSPQEYIMRGWDEMIDALLAVYEAPRRRNEDPCKIGGEGWIAEEAIAVSLHTLLCFPGNPTDALRRAAFTNGDSDSIASITGALAGAAYGRRAFPHHWMANLEYRREIDSVTARLASAAR